MNRINTGIAGLDEMLCGGIPENHIVTVIGNTGTGKTTFALQFIHTGLQQGEPCVYISLEESIDSLVETAKNFGWDLMPFIEKQKLSLLQLSASDVLTSTSRIESELPSLLKTFGAKRLVLDPVTLFEMLFDEASERRKEVFALAQLVKHTGITALFTSESSPEDPYRSKFGLIEYIADGVISLKYIRPSDLSEVVLAINIVKMRRTKHARVIKPYDITEKGIKVFTESKVF